MLGKSRDTGFRYVGIYLLAHVGGRYSSDMQVLVAHQEGQRGYQTAKHRSVSTFETGHTRKGQCRGAAAVDRDIPAKGTGRPGDWQGLGRQAT